MAPRSARILFAILSILTVVVHISAASRGPLLGGWKPIDNPNAPEVVKIAKFAVDEHNKKQHTSLSFVSVLKGESQTVAGVNYKLEISAKDGAAAAAAAPKNYTAVVYSRVWEHYLELTSFKPATKG